jgi:TetR/AcrR family transcriptional regulator, regulator of autoinduction and epiphytic fitness
VAAVEPIVPGDGRSARSQRTRDAVVESLLAWLRDGNLRPTAKDIADRAGISVRSVYVHFDDLDDLFCAASERTGREIEGLLELISTEQSFEARLQAVIDQRVRVFEVIMPVKRAGALQEPFSQPLAAIFTGMRSVQRDEIERVFAAELGAIAPEARDAALAAAHLVTVEEAWSFQRNAMGLDVAAARSAMEHALRSILEPRS